MNGLNDYTDDMLVSLYINGNDEAFDELLNRYQSKVFEYILISVKKQELAEDIFQDVFIKVIVSLRSGKYTGNGKFLQWVIRVARNHMLDRARHLLTIPTVVSSDDEDVNYLNDSSVAINENRELEIINEQTVSDIEYLTTLLPANQQDIIRLRIYEELSFKEIAERLDISINTALGRMHYAINNLRKLANANGLTA
ncbi:MAG: sigma-70 family RNA polymerase sigma factor [Bacteroidaceae bacterium]|nr:sigma-70 family RNA polymerase sigma factor [Bacteroidaceae bacterium]